MKESQLTLIAGVMGNVPIIELLDISERLVIMGEKQPMLRDSAEVALNLIRDNLKGREAEAVALVFNMCGMKVPILTGEKIDLSKGKISLSKSLVTS